MTGKSKLVFLESSFESVEKLPAKDNTEYFDGQKELVSTGNPTPLIGREPSPRDDAMQMGMPSPVKERHASLIQQMTEELQKMEVEYHELNVEQIREELKGGQSDR